MQEIDSIFSTIKKLRDPESGCAWDKIQTLKTLTKPLEEETAELIEALEEDSKEHIAEELGDVLWNVCTLLAAAEDEGVANKEDIIKAVEKKIIGRHPHVFGAINANSPEEAKTAYLAAKAEQRKRE